MVMIMFMLVRKSWDTLPTIIWFSINGMMTRHKNSFLFFLGYYFMLLFCSTYLTMHDSFHQTAKKLWFEVLMRHKFHHWPEQPELTQIQNFWVDPFNCKLSPCKEWWLHNHQNVTQQFWWFMRLQINLGVVGWYDASW